MTKPASISKQFSKFSRNELLEFCRDLYAQRGISAFSYPALKQIPKLYPSLYQKDLSQKTILQELGIEAEYKAYRLLQPFKYGGAERVRWSWEVILNKSREIFATEGRLPPALWFQKNGHASLIQALYNLGHTWDELRAAVGDFSNSNFVRARNGLRWLSHAEASLSNFLYARGIAHTKGKRYPDSFKDFSKTRYAIYDLHFEAKSGEWVDVEVWGDRPNGHNEKKYAETRTAKEAFNFDNTHFLGLHHSDCYDEEKLTSSLEQYIGRIEPFQFDKPTDALIHSVHWSNADELLDYSKDIASKMPDGKFPSEDWLRKRGRWASREGEAYNTLAVYAKLWLGGIRNLRKLIGQADLSTSQWNKESAVAAYSKFFDEHGLTPHQARHAVKTGNDSPVSRETAKYAACICTAMGKYAGGVQQANIDLGIVTVRRSKWTKEKVLALFKHTLEEYEQTPQQLIYQSRRGQIVLAPEKVKLLTQLTDAYTRFPGGLPAIYQALGIAEAPHRRSKKQKQSG
jgi:hypothetical protein